MSEHTKEPWHTGGDGTIIYDLDGWGVASATVFHGKREPESAPRNANRIVACVNACAGISTEQLEKGKTGWLAMTPTYAEAVEQRDELLEALKSIKDQPNCRHEVEAQLGADTWKIIDEVEQSK